MKALKGPAVGSGNAVDAAAAQGPAPGKQTLAETQPAPGTVPGAVIVTASSLRVRSSTDTSSKANVLGKLHEGERVAPTGKAGDWLQIPYGAGQGFIAGQHTRPATFVEDVDAWIRSMFGSNNDAEKDPDPAGPQEPVAPAGPGTPHEPADPDTPHAPTPAPSGTATLSDPVFAAYAATLGNARVDAAVQAVASCEQQSAALAEDLNRHEEKGAARDTLVESIGQARAQIALLDGEGLDAEALGRVRPALYQLLNRCAPYYSQGRNINVLETDDPKETRTCSITTLAMVLEGLGKSAGGYTGPREKVLAVARHTTYAPRVAGAAGKAAAGGGDWGAMAALRLPDFLQLAAIAEEMNGGTSDEEVITAAQSAWKKISKEFDIHLHLAKRFGVTGKTKALEGGLGSALGSVKKAARKDMQKAVDARNDAERSGDAGDQAKYERLRDERTEALEGEKIEDKAPLDDYRATVIEHIGGELASGAGVFMLMAGHYARVQSVSEEHVVVDDPGMDFRSGQKVLWPEARAMGYFKKRIVFSG